MANVPITEILTRDVWSVWDVGKPQKRTELVRRYGYQNQGTFEMIQRMSREKPVANTVYSGYEDNEYHRAITVKTSVSDQGAGNDLDVTLAAADLDSSNRYYPRVGDVVTMANEAQARIHSIDDTTDATAPVLTLRPLQLTSTLGAVTAGDTLPITSGAFAAGTGQPDGTVVGVEERTFYTQTFKETSGAEGDMLATENWFAVYDTGEDVKGWFTTNMLRADYLFGLKIDGAFTIGDETTNTANVVPSGEDGAGNSIYTTKGFVPHIRDNGFSDTYTESSFAIEDLRDIGSYMRSQYVNSGNIMIMSGVDLSNDINSAAKDYFVTDTGSAIMTQISEGAFGGAENMAGILNFKVINLGDGFNYFIYVMDNWSNPKTFGTSDLAFNKKGAILPVTSFKDPNPRGEGSKVDNFYTRYRSFDGYNRKIEMWTVGGAGGGTYVTDVDNRYWYLRGEMGLEMYKTNQTVIIDPA